MNFQNGKPKVGWKVGRWNSFNNYSKLCRLQSHENLLKELIPVKRRLEAHLKNLQRQEFGQGQNFDEIQEFKDKIMQLDNEIEESKENVKKFERIYKNIMQILD